MKTQAEARENRWLIVGARLALGGITLVAIAVQAVYVAHADVFNLFNYFGYFTNLSNLLAAAVCIGLLVIWVGTLRTRHVR